MKLFENLTTQKIYAEDKEKAVLILTLGSMKTPDQPLQIGGYNVLASNFAAELADQIPDSFLMPPLYYGATDVGGTPYKPFVFGLLRGLVEQGWKKILIVSGFPKNKPSIEETVTSVRDLYKREGIKICITEGLVLEEAVLEFIQTELGITAEAVA